MEKQVILSSRVLTTINSLPKAERKAVANALMQEIILGETPDEMSPIATMLYSMIRFYINQDTIRYNRSLESVDAV